MVVSWLQSCLRYPVRCPNGCNEQIPREDTASYKLEKAVSTMEAELHTERQRVRDLEECIRQLQSDNKVQAQHMQDLETDAAAKTERISDLETDAAAKTERISELEKDTTIKAHHIIQKNKKLKLMTIFMVFGLVVIVPSFLYFISRRKRHVVVRYIYI